VTRKKDKSLINLVEITLLMVDIPQGVVEVAEEWVDLVAMVASNILICNRQMKYLDNFLEAKTLLQISSMMMMISLVEVDSVVAADSVILDKWEEEWEEWVVDKK